MYYVSAHHNPDTRESGWAMYFKPFDSSKATSIPHLRDLFRTWPGQSIVFKIHRGYVYILSNQSKVAPVPQSGYPVDDEDENSYYQCYRFPADDLEAGPGHSAPSCLETVRIWRPSPKAEPVNKPSLDDLTLQEDESTGELIIVERRQTSTSDDTNVGDQSRYEFQPVVFPDWDRIEKDDLQFRLITGLSQGQLCRGLKTFGQADRCLRRPAHRCPNLDLAETRYRAYNLSCDASVNLSYETLRVNDSAGDQKRQGMHIHVSSRKHRGSASTHDDKDLAPQHTFSGDEGEVEEYETHAWPPVDAPKRLLELLNPFPGRDCNVRAQSDECSIMYMVGLKEGEWIPKHKESKFQVGDLVYLTPEATERMRRKDEEAQNKLGDDDLVETRSVEEEEGSDESEDEVDSVLSDHNQPRSPATLAQSMETLAVDDKSHADKSDTNRKIDGSQHDDHDHCDSQDGSNVVTEDFSNATDSTGEGHTDPAHLSEKSGVEGEVAENHLEDEGGEISHKSSMQQIKLEKEPADRTTQGHHDDHNRQEDHAIILINFDGGIYLPGPERMHLKSDTDHVEGSAVHVPAVTSAHENIGEGSKPTTNAEGVEEAAGSEMSWFREERASWSDIGRGLEFTYEDDGENPGS